MYDGMTGLAANIDETSSKKSFLNKFKKKKQETEEKPKKEKKEKVDPKSTKLMAVKFNKTLEKNLCRMLNLFKIFNNK